MCAVLNGFIDASADDVRGGYYSVIPSVAAWAQSANAPLEERLRSIERELQKADLLAPARAALTDHAFQLLQALFYQNASYAGWGFDVMRYVLTNDIPPTSKVLRLLTDAKTRYWRKPFEDPSQRAAAYRLSVMVELLGAQMNGHGTSRNCGELRCLIASMECEAEFAAAVFQAEYAMIMDLLEAAGDSVYESLMIAR
jgi:hypothetical protein